MGFVYEHLAKILSATYAKGYAAVSLEYGNVQMSAVSIAKV
jgi:hypothetical protein